MRKFILALPIGALALCGCGAINAGKAIITDIKNGGDPMQSLATVAAADLQNALADAQASNDLVAQGCWSKLLVLAQIQERQGPSPGIATDLQRARDLKNQNIRDVCAPMLIGIVP